MSDFDKIRRVGRLYIILNMFIGRLTTTHSEVLQRSDQVECPQPSERVTVAGSDNEQGPIYHGVRVDGEWECQRVHQVPSGC